MSTSLKLSEEDTIKARVPGDPVPALKTIDPGMSKYSFDDMRDKVEFAKMMSQAGPMLPAHAQNNPGVCLALLCRAEHWGIDPFGLAMESYQASKTPNAPVAYQASVYKTVAIKAGVNFEYIYTGETHFTADAAKSAKGNQVAGQTAAGTRQVTVRAEVAGHIREYTSPTLKDIKVKNSPLWHNDPDQQLASYGARAWMRRYRPDLMMGALSVDELQDASPMRDVTPKESGWTKMAKEARGEVPPDEATKEEPEDHGDDIEDAKFEDGKAPADDGDAGHWTDRVDPSWGVPDSEEWEAGSEAFLQDAPYTDNPHNENVDAAQSWARGWLDTKEEAG
tara:strand:- start:5043 stop:6050 length:1008 start_codon:yes stop_codon:yes gene_type:complete